MMWGGRRRSRGKLRGWIGLYSTSESLARGLSPPFLPSYPHSSCPHTIIPLVLGRGDRHLGHVTIPFKPVTVPTVHIFDIGDAGAVSCDGLDLQKLEARMLVGV